MIGLEIVCKEEMDSREGLAFEMSCTLKPPFCYFTYYVSEKIVRVTTTKPFIDEYQQLWIVLH